jgi:hypothetical protein
VPNLEEASQENDRRPVAVQGRLKVQRAGPVSSAGPPCPANRLPRGPRPDDGDRLPTSRAPGDRGVQRFSCDKLSC